MQDQDHGPADPAPAVKQLLQHQNHRDCQAALQKYLDYLEEEEERPRLKPSSASASTAVGPSATNIHNNLVSLVSLGCVSVSSAPAVPQAHAGLALLILLAKLVGFD